jgi:hypothetical protein
MSKLKLPKLPLNKLVQKANQLQKLTKLNLSKVPN